MRVLAALMKHETNTFSPVVTDLARFARGQSLPFTGAEAYQAFKGTGSAPNWLASKQIRAKVSMFLSCKRLTLQP